MKNKKGIVEVQFNWIFVLIVGGILIITITGVIIKQKNSAESSVRATLLNTLRSMISSSSASSGAAMSVSMPKAEVVYECNKLYIGDISKSYNGLVMFGPSLLKGKNITMQNIVLDMPYRTANFLYTSTDEVRYILVYDASNTFAKSVDESISPKFKKTSVNSLSEISNEFNSKVRFVFFGTPPPLPPDFSTADLNQFNSMPDKDVTAVVVNSIAGENYGTVAYYRKENSGGNYKWKVAGTVNTVNYFKIPSLIGAIFMDSGDETAEQYNCVMKNALQRMKLVTEFYKKKVGSFDNIPNTKISKACEDQYDSLITTDIFSTISSNLDNNNFAGIVSSINELIKKNSELQSNSCPLIY